MSAYSTKRFAAWRSGGFSAQNFIRSRKFKFKKNCHTKHVRPHYAKPLLAAGVLSTVLVNHCLYVGVSVVVGLCVRVFFLFSEGQENFLFIFFRENKNTLFAAWFACWLVAAAKCVCLCALAFYFANCNILYAPLATITKTIAPIIKSG